MIVSIDDQPRHFTGLILRGRSEVFVQRLTEQFEWEYLILLRLNQPQRAHDLIIAVTRGEVCRALVILVRLQAIGIGFDRKKFAFKTIDSVAKRKNLLQY
jgi:hypothetical protein